MKILKVDDKWSIQYDPDKNDRPLTVMRHGEAHDPNGDVFLNNFILALFYALLEARGE